MFIQIISRPPGDAPEHIRDEWVGKVLESGGAFKGFVHGVINKDTVKIIEYYRVPFDRAMLVLPKATADWWREHCSHLIGRTFAFDASCCQEVESPN